MNRTITVKGMGKINAKPDLAILTVNLEAKEMEYEAAIVSAAKKINNLQDSITSVGFQKTDLKTTKFEVSPQFENVRDKINSYKLVFDGYVVIHNLKLEFDLDMKRMSEVLTALANCGANPEFTIAFSVKNKSMVRESLLINATENAKAKAAILAKASGVKLGQIIRIDYNWGELQLYSHTRYNAPDMMMVSEDAPSIDIEPEDIDVSDSVTLIWEII